MRPDITVVIPNWNGAPLLREVLRSLAGQTLPPARVIVVDGGSRDSSAEVARAAGVEWLSLPENQGFARAVNLGIARVDTGGIAILNNDVVLDAGWLEVMAKALGGGAWFASGKLLRYGHAATLDGSFDLISRAACPWRAGHGSPDSVHWQRPRQVEFPSFTAGVFRRELFERAGPLDERFESYLEDIDFGLRCARLRLTGLYLPAASAQHHGSATLGAWNPRMVRLLSRNQLFLVARHYPEGWWERYGGQILIGQALWGALAFRRGVFGDWVRGKLEGLQRFRELRRSASPWPAAEFADFMARSEREIFTLQRLYGFDSYWHVYFRWCGEAV